MKLTIDSCCKNCEARRVGCHSECDRYIKAKAEYDEAMQKYKDAKGKDADINVALRDGINRKKERKK